MLDTDVQGARHMKAESSGVEARYVFIRPPSFEVLERLRGRGTEREEDVRRRLERARAEAEGAVEGGLYDTIWRGRLGSWKSGCLEASGVVSRDGMCRICCRSVIGIGVG